MSSQSTDILSYLKSGLSITPLSALKLFGCLRLSARIHELRKRGHKIHAGIITTRKGARVAEYWLAK